MLDIMTMVVGAMAMFMDFFTSALLNLVYLVIRVIIALTLYASAKYNKSNHPLIWGIAGFFFPIISLILYILLYNSKAKEELFCTPTDKCYKEVMHR